MGRAKEMQSTRRDASKREVVLLKLPHAQAEPLNRSESEVRRGRQVFRHPENPDPIFRGLPLQTVAPFLETLASADP